MVAVGTLITERPPHRSRRALLTHRAPPSGRTSAARSVNPRALRRTAANRIDVAPRLSVRTTAACRLFPSGEALPSTISAGSCLPLFDRFLGTTTSSDFSPTYMLGVRLLPSRAGPARVRARVRPPRFRAKNFSTCTRSPTARGSPIQANTRWEMLPSRQQNAIGTSELDPFRSSILGPWSPLGTLHVGPRGTPRITRGWDGWLDLSHGGLSPPILCQLPWRTLSWVIRYRSLRVENRSMSAMRRRRRRAVKMSPVAMGHKQSFSPLASHRWRNALLDHES